MAAILSRVRWVQVTFSCLYRHTRYTVRSGGLRGDARDDDLHARDCEHRHVRDDGYGDGYRARRDGDGVRDRCRNSVGNGPRWRNEKDGLKCIALQWCQVATKILVNNGSGNGLLPDGTNYCRNQCPLESIGIHPGRISHIMRKICWQK